MPSITNVNDLPQEVHKAFFDHFNPVERTSILSTCKRWYDLIMNTKGWWRAAEVGEDCSKEKMMRILQVFDQRSQGSLIKVQINRKIETKGELQEVLFSIEPSVGSIKLLVLRQDSHLNTQTRTFARRMPQLRSLHTLSVSTQSDPLVMGTGLIVLETNSLDDIEQEEVEWLSQLKTLGILYIHSERTLRLVLSSCKSTLNHLLLGDLGFQEGQEFRSGEPIVMKVLTELQINPSTPTLPLIAPALEFLQGTLSQTETTESPSLRFMTLVLEGEEEEDEEQVDEFVERYKLVFQKRPDLRYIAVEGTAHSNVQLQSQCILQALLISDENKKDVLLPSLLALHIKNFEDVLDLKALAKLDISRVKYFWGSKMDVETLEKSRSERVFVVSLNPADPSLKYDMMEQYLKMRESMYDDWINELKPRRSESNLDR